jgi:hypothetical protein
MPRITAVEDGFREPATWAHLAPPPPSHAALRLQGQAPEHSPHLPVSSSSSAPSAPLATPTGQRRGVDLHAPNGSASTIAEHPSAASSSAANTPSAMELDRRPHGPRPAAAAAAGATGIDYDAVDGKNGFRSQSTSPFDMRKGPPPLGHRFNNQSPLPTDIRSDAAPHNVGYATSPSRLGGLFGPAKLEASPPMPAKPVPAVHASGIAGPSRMTKITI